MATQDYNAGNVTYGAANVGKPKKKKHQSGASTGVYGTPSSGGNTNQGSGTAKDKPRKHPPGKPFKWDNGTYHTRRQGEQFRTGHGGGHGGGGPAAPTVPHPLVDQANAMADMRYGGAEQSLQQRGQAIAPWFQNYMNEVGAAQTQSAQYAAPIQAQAQTNAQQAGQVAPGVDPNSQAGHDATLAAAARQAIGQSFVTALQGLGQVQNDFYGGRKAVAATAQAGEQSQLARDQTALAKEKGAYQTTALQDLRQTRHKNRLENAAFGLDVSKASDAAANTAADNARADQQARQNRRDKNRDVITSGPFAGFTQAQVRKLSPAEKAKLRTKASTGTGAGKSRYTPQQVSKSNIQLRKGVSAIKRALEGKQYAPTDFWKKAYNDLLDAGYDPLMARAAIQVVRRGGVGGGVARRLRRDYGITRTPRGKPMKKPPAFTLRPITQTPGPNGEQRPG